jgi:hypothetical protein
MKDKNPLSVFFVFFKKNAGSPLWQRVYRSTLKSTSNVFFVIFKIQG